MNGKLAAVLTAVAIGTAACGGGGGTARDAHSPSSAPAATQAAGKYNAQDVMFAQMMIPHHRQAVEMSDIVLKGSTDPEIRKLAEQIRKAQGPEIETMTGWLREWGAPLPDDRAPATGHGGHEGHGGMAGMMTAAQMAEFRRLKGRELDRRFLTMMIEHHEGAVTMAKDEQAKGSHPAAKTMAGEIVRTQQQEITEMRGLLKR
ncbi:DUF305 domain-containing protein [Actinomadura kijaniata]|uniref:Uncharacterized protein (DUF305 family) n=1 Tax=Actinomadura namibiensis TaxID=182080 RepID=A0A7W3LZM8_ACTNM|nr:DUF305 domain-containing protein [Actinomadura namibiensis]MBA8957142.1 uncharacterized protein (DUF305 family) [Actinomadura namibiensis]